MSSSQQQEIHRKRAEIDPHGQYQKPHGKMNPIHLFAPRTICLNNICHPWLLLVIASFIGRTAKTSEFLDANTVALASAEILFFMDLSQIEQDHE